MALPLFIRKLIAPVEVKLVLSALSEETLLIIDDPKRELGGRIATDIATPKVVSDVLDWSKNIEKDIQNDKPPRVLALYLMMNVARDYLASGRFHIYRVRCRRRAKHSRG
jgi:hypothetical protein